MSNWRQRIQQLRTLQDLEIRRLGKVVNTKKWYQHRSYVEENGKFVLKSALELVGGKEKDENGKTLVG